MTDKKHKFTTNEKIQILRDSIIFITNVLEHSKLLSPETAGHLLSRLEGISAYKYQLRVQDKLLNNNDKFIF